MVTPAGPIGILYPLRYVEGGDWGLANIQEWQSPNFHEPAHMGFLLMIVALGLNGGRSTPGWLVTLSWIGVAMGLLALRNAPIAVVFAMPTLVMGLESRLRARDARRTKARQTMTPSVALARRVMELVTAAGHRGRIDGGAHPARHQRGHRREHRRALPGGGGRAAAPDQAGCERLRRVRLGRVRDLAHARSRWPRLRGRPQRHVRPAGAGGLHRHPCRRSRLGSAGEPSTRSRRSCCRRRRPSPAARPSQRAGARCSATSGRCSTCATACPTSGAASGTGSASNPRWAPLPRSRMVARTPPGTPRWCSRGRHPPGPKAGAGPSGLPWGPTR